MPPNLVFQLQHAGSPTPYLKHSLVNSRIAATSHRISTICSSENRFLKQPPKRQTLHDDIQFIRICDEVLEADSQRMACRRETVRKSRRF